MSPERGRSSRQRKPPPCTSIRSAHFRLPIVWKSRQKGSGCCCSLFQKRQIENFKLPARTLAPCQNHGRVKHENGQAKGTFSWSAIPSSRLNSKKRGVIRLSLYGRIATRFISQPFQ